MSLSCQAYVLPERVATAQFIGQLGVQLAIESEPDQTLIRTYLDTFDWRLYDAGGPLLAKQLPGDAYSLIWEDAGNDKPMASVRCGRLPTRAAELPPGHLRDRLTRVTTPRALLPLVTLHSRLQRLRVLNADGKTIARLRIESPLCGQPGKSPRIALPARLTLVPVKGHGDEAARIDEYLTGTLGLRPARRSFFIEALGALGRIPGDYSSRLRIELTPDLPAVLALQQILSVLLDTLQRNLPGTKAALDSEFLHDARVATRRARAALSQIKGVLPPVAQADLQQGLRWLGQVTGPTRDLDVLILAFPAYQHSLPAALRADLDPLLPYLEQRQLQAQQQLVRRLDSPHLHRLLKDWQTTLADLPDTDDAPHARRPIKRLADRRIWHRYRRVLKDGRAIDAHSPPADLHRLRKDCKKLRYLLEFFRTLYPGKRIKPLIKQLKALLDNLGEFQDLQVQAGKLRGLAEDLQGEQHDRLPVVLAIGTLIGDLLQRQQQARSAFAACLARFDDPAQDGVYRRLFKSAKGDGR